MPNFQAKDSQVLSRQLKVVRLVIPFTIAGNATPASVVSATDEPAFMFIATQGVDNITPNLPSGDTATYSVSPTDSSGTFNVLLSVKEPVTKVCSTTLKLRDTGATGQVAKLGSTTGISTLGQCVMVTCVSTVALNASNTLTGVLEVEYTVATG